MLDYLIKNARIADGTGAPIYNGAVGVSGDEIPLQGVAADELDEEALTASVAADEKAHGAAAPIDLLQIREECGDLVAPSDGDIRRARARHDTGRNRGQKRPQHTARHFYLILIGVFHICLRITITQ